MLTGERFDAAEARDIGLVTHVTSDVVETVDEICAGVLEPPMRSRQRNGCSPRCRASIAPSRSLRCVP